MNVVEEPGDSANPLVIHGPVGTGKTHLLEGIFAGLKRRTGFHPCYVTAEEFTTKFVQSARLGKMSAFRRQFRECSALLLDNLNFLANKRGSVEEFLYVRRAARRRTASGSDNGLSPAPGRRVDAGTRRPLARRRDLGTVAARPRDAVGNLAQEGDRIEPHHPRCGHKVSICQPLRKRTRTGRRDQ